MQHPADANQYRKAIRELRRDHDVSVFVRDRDGTVSEILEAYGIDHTVLVSQSPASPNLFRTQLEYEYRLLKRARRIEPDVIVATGGVAAAHVATIVGCESIVFCDTEHAKLSHCLTFPFADTICTPDCYGLELGSKQESYPSYQELAYLHPRVFEPDSAVLDRIDAERGDRLVVLRQVAWNALHDRGDAGFDDVFDVIERLEAAGARVLISSEEPLPDSLASYRIDVPTHMLHDLLYYADLFVGESPTMAAESAVLGTPAIFVSTSRRGYTDELDQDYGLVFTYSGTDRQSRAVRKAVEILEEYAPEEWERRRNRMLDDKTDATRFIVRTITGEEIIDERPEPRDHAETVL